jgi:hypothetical protein
MYVDVYAADTCSSMERSRLCAPMATQSNFVSSTDYSFVPSSGGGESFLSAIWGGVKWIVWQIWNVITTALYIIGCPVDSCLGYVSGRYAALVNYMNAPRSPSEAPAATRVTSNGSGPTGRRLGGNGGSSSGGGDGDGRGRNGRVYSPLRQVDNDKDDDDMRSTSIEV